MIDDLIARLEELKAVEREATLSLDAQTDPPSPSLAPILESAAKARQRMAAMYCVGLVLSASHLAVLSGHAAAHEEPEIAKITADAAADALLSAITYAKGGLTHGELYVAHVTAGQKLHYYQPERVKARRLGESPSGEAWWEKADEQA